jgi:hypothetical protein
MTIFFAFACSLARTTEASSNLDFSRLILAVAAAAFAASIVAGEVASAMAVATSICFCRAVASAA